MLLIVTITFVLLDSKMLVEGQYKVRDECHPDNKEIHGTTIENFELIADDSKYGVTDKAFRNDAETAIPDFKAGKEYCEKMGMQLGNIKSVDDFKVIDSYLLTKYPKCSHYQWLWLTGSSLKPGDVWWWDSDSEPTGFQIFHGYQPYRGKIQNEKWDRDYSVLVCVTKESDMVGPEFGHAFRDTPHQWRYNLGIICQFRRDSPCYENSKENKVNAENEKKEELVEMGTTATRKYFAGYRQKRFEDAETICTDHEMKMLDLEVTDKDEASTLHKFMVEFIEKHGLVPTATSFLMSGVVSKLFMGSDAVPFEWDWIDSRRECNDDNFFFNYMKTQHSAQGKCLSVGTLFKDKVQFTVSTAFCQYYNWYICYGGPDASGKDKGRSFKKRKDKKDKLGSPYDLIERPEKEKSLVQNNQVEPSVGTVPEVPFVLPNAEVPPTKEPTVREAFAVDSKAVNGMDLQNSSRRRRQRFRGSSSLSF